LVPISDTEGGGDGPEISGTDGALGTIDGVGAREVFATSVEGIKTTFRGISCRQIVIFGRWHRHSDLWTC